MSISSLTSSRPAGPTTRSRRRTVSHGAGFWVASASLLVVMAYNTVPTPLWSLYQRRDGFSTFAVTIAFAAYAVGVVVSLLLAGHLGDTRGRRRILLSAVGLEIVSSVLFMTWPDLPGLIVARVVAGLGVGMLTATITAHIMDLHLRARPDAGPLRGQIVAGATNLGGFGVGAVTSGVLAQWVGAPLVTPYVVFLVLLVLVFVGIAVVPETADVPDVVPAYRPQRVRVPHDARGRFFLAGGITFAAFSILGLFTSLAPGFIVGQLGITSHATAGLVVFLTFSAAALAQIATHSLEARTQITLGTSLVVIGLVLLAVVVSTVGSLAWFALGGVLCGAGVGPLFRASLAVAASLAEPAHRGEVLAGIFLTGYLGLTVPVVGVGVATLSVSLAAALDGFATIIIAITVFSAGSLLVALRRAEVRPAGAAS